MSNAVKYQSLSEEGKVIVRQFIEDGKEYERKELVTVIKERTERKAEMTEGVIAGVIKMLTASNEITVVSRGRYKKGIPMNSQTMQEKVIVLFNKFKENLDKICMVNALELKEEDIKFIGKLNEVCNNLEAFIWELEDMREERKEQTEKPVEPTEHKIKPTEPVKKEVLEVKGVEAKDKKMDVDNGKGKASEKKEEKVIK